MSMSGSATVLACRETDDPFCVGPPDTFPASHHGTPEPPARHILVCNTCAATTMQCWRSGCDPASQPYQDVIEELANSYARKAAAYGTDNRDDAYSEVSVELTMRLLSRPAFSPEQMLTRDDLGAYLGASARNAYIRWFNALMKRLAITRFQLAAAAGEELDLDSPEEGGSEEFADVITTMARSFAHEASEPDPYLDDPSELITTRLRHELVSETGMKRALATTVDGLRLIRLEDSRYLAEFIKHCSKGGSLRSWCRDRYGVDPNGLPNKLSTTQRRLARIRAALGAHIAAMLDEADGDRELALNFLHFSLIDLDHERPESDD